MSARIHHLEDCIIILHQTLMSHNIGTDTMVRIINPKYYGNRKEHMIKALEDMNSKGVHFIVGGRLEQGMDNS